MDHHHEGGLQISPLLLGLLGVMAGALIVATFHCIIVCWCSDMQNATSTSINTRASAARRSNHRQNYVGDTDYREHGSTSSGGLSFSNVQVIVTSNYSKESEEDLCAVCLTEFKQGDEVGILPECTHIFHVPCIDKWLNCHNNCPLCRAETLPSPRDLVCSLPRSDGVLPPE